MNKSTAYTIALEEDPDTGDLILPLSDEILEQAGWTVGDTLDWSVQDDRSIVVSKVKNES